MSVRSVKNKMTTLTEEEKKRAKILGLNNIIIEKAHPILGEYWYRHIIPHQDSWRSTDEAMKAIGMTSQEYEKLKEELNIIY